MSVSSPAGAADTESFQHHSRTLGLLHQAFRPHGPWPVTACGWVQVSRRNSPRTSHMTRRSLRPWGFPPTRESSPNAVTACAETDAARKKGSRRDDPPDAEGSAAGEELRPKEKTGWYQEVRHH